MIGDNQIPRANIINADRAGALLELLVQINREVAGALDLRTVLQRLVFAAMQHVGGERGSIIVVDGMGRPIDSIIVYGTSLHEHTTQQLKETFDRGLAGWVIRIRKPALVPDTSLDERWLRRPDDASERSGAKSALCVPLLARGALVGVLTVVHSVPNAFGTEHLELAQVIADQASIAVLNARLYTESERQARIMTALAGAAAFSSSLDVHEVWQRVLDQTIQALQVETAAIGLLDQAPNEIVFMAAAGQDSGRIIERRAARDRELTGEVLRDGRGVVIANVAEDSRYTQFDRFPGVDARAVALVPIQAQGRLIGVLEAINPISRLFDPDALTVMMGIGGMAGATIGNALLFEALQKAHQRYLELFEESIDPIFVTNGDGRITEVNHQAALLTGYTSDALRSMSIGQIHQVAWREVGMHFERLRETGRAAYEAALRGANGRTSPVEVHARSVEFGSADSILWMLRDLTARKELDALRQNLTSMIYHDLRSPLGNVASSLDLLAGLLGENQSARSALEIAVRSTDRVMRLVNSLLDIHRLEAGQAVTNQSRTGPGELVRTAVADVMPSAAGRNQEIRTDIPGSLPEIWVDADMLRRVLVNLLENAIKFSSPGRKIEIGVRPETGRVQIWVRDQGRGIPSAERKHIFTKFARGGHGTQSQQGLGLGLAFCKLAVEAHGGMIGVESEEGLGSTFIVTLPAKSEGF